VARYIYSNLTVNLCNCCHLQLHQIIYKAQVLILNVQYKHIIIMQMQLSIRELKYKQEYLKMK